MVALRDIQSTFLHDIYSGDLSSVVYFGKRFSERLSIYRNNTLFGLVDVLKNIYPVLEQIVGEEFFAMMARHYMSQHPQSGGNRHTFGGELAVFLKSFEPAAVLPYLPDVAALEWAHFQASIASDAEVLDFNRLAAAIAEPSFVLLLHPSVRNLTQSYNALDIWKEHQKENPGTIQLTTPEETTLIIWRAPDDSILIREISAAFAKLVSACFEGRSFAESMMLAEEACTDIIEFQQEFAKAVVQGVFARSGREE